MAGVVMAMHLPGSLATMGYGDPTTGQELSGVLIANPHALIIDTRLTPYCSYDPQWSLSQLQDTYGTRYCWRGDWLGNIHHRHPDKPMELANATAGLPWLIRGLEQGYSLILLCGCSNAARCHRTFIYTLVKERLGSRLPEYTLGQRVLTPDGPGHINPAIPLQVQRARNRYGVILDGSHLERYYAPAQLHPFDITQPTLLSIA